MSDSKRVVLELPAISGFEKVAMAAAESLARDIGFPEDRVQDLKIALGEACANAIEHGAEADCQQKVGLAFSVDEGSVEVEVRDPGEGISDAPPPPDLNKKLSGEDPSLRGWGFHIINSLVDEASIENEGDGTVLRMVIRIGTGDKEG